ncbi:hypothetical protein BKA83DRAFT_102630 [Pisolithus microcarpus]|nr:hypothetical protein BKA83DRAFT_102630 [Pisolithus microcarpus]
MFLSYCQRFDGPLKTVYEAYAKLSHDELILFLKVRNLPTPGTDSELASRLAQHDFHTYHFPAASVEPQSSSDEDSEPRPSQVRTPDLPVELLAYIIGRNACRTDLAMLTGSIPDIRAADPATNPPTRLGTAAAIRFEYVHDDLIPITASKHGRTAVLAWWKHGFEQHPDHVHPPKSGSIAEAVDSASRNGKIASLDWWISSGLPFEYTEAALEQASARNRIAAALLKTGLPLKIGRVMEMASNAGHVDVLEWWASSQLEYPLDRHILQRASTLGKIQVLNWWLGSGLQLIFDHEALIGATRHNRSEVLEWWDKSGLHIQYRMCDIEEALEEAMGGGDRARDWWKKKGVDFNADDKEWMKLQTLN